MYEDKVNSCWWGRTTHQNKNPANVPHILALTRLLRCKYTFNLYVIAIFLGKFFT